MLCCAFTLRLIQPSTISSPTLNRIFTFYPVNSKPELLVKKTITVSPHFLGPNNDRSMTWFWEIKQLNCIYEELRTEDGYPSLGLKTCSNNVMKHYELTKF